MHCSSPVSARCVCVYGWWNHTPAAVPVGGHAWHWVGVLCLGCVGRGHICTCWLCQPPAERCATLPGGWGRVGTAFSPSVTQQRAIPNLYHLGSQSLNRHLLCFPQCGLCRSRSPKGASTFLVPSPLPWGVGGWDCTQQSLPGQMLLVEALIALGRS